MEIPELSETRDETPAGPPHHERRRPAPEQAEVHFKDYLAVVRRRKGVILLFSGIVLGLTALYVLQLPRAYQATAQLVIERRLFPVTSTEERANQDLREKAFYETMYSLLKNRGLALQVIKEVGPELISPAGPARKPSFFGWVLGLLPASAPEPPAAAADPATAAEERLLEVYFSGLTIKPIKETRLVNVSFRSASAPVAARVANAHARAFIERDHQMKLTAAQQGLKWLNAQLEEQKAKVEASQAAVQRYLRDQEVISFEDRQNIVSQKLMELNSNLTRARNERSARQAVHEQMSNAEFEGEKIYSLPEVAQDSIILGLRNQVIQLRSRQIELSSNLGPKHPRMIELSTRLQELEEQKKHELRRLQGTIRADLSRAREYEEALQAALEEQKKQAQALSAKGSDYNVLLQEVRSNQDAYDVLLKQAKEMHLTSGLESGNIKIVDEAKVPGQPVNAKKSRYLILAALVSLGLGTYLAFFLEYMDQSVKSSEDVKMKLHLPVLGMVPHYQFAKKAQEPVLLWDDPGLKKEKSASDYYYYYGVNAANRLIQHLQWRVQQDQGRVFAFVSAGAGEGKTTVLANAAKILARRGLRVLVLDADTYHPSLHRMFGLEDPGGGLMAAMKKVLPQETVVGNRDQPGPADAPISERLSRLAGGRVLEEEVFSRMLAVGERLTLLPAGEGKTELSGVFSLALLAKILELLKKRFDVVLVDTPPLLEVAEAVPLAALVDGAILVIRAGRLPAKSLGEAAESLHNAGAKILGAVLNGLRQ